MCYGDHARAVRGRHPQRPFPSAGGAVPPPALAGRTGSRGAARQVGHVLCDAFGPLLRRACRERPEAVQRPAVHRPGPHGRPHGRHRGAGRRTALCGCRLPQHFGRRGEGLRPHPHGGPGPRLRATLCRRGPGREPLCGPCLRREMCPRHPALLLLVGPCRPLPARRLDLPLPSGGGGAGGWHALSRRSAGSGRSRCRPRSRCLCGQGRNGRRGDRCRCAGRRLPGSFCPPLRAGISLPFRAAQRHRPAPGTLGPS